MTTMFTVGRDDLRRTRWLDTAPVALAPGEARLRIDPFALTSNNVTYGAFGEAMHYWDFFPTGDAGTGLHPGLGLRDRRANRSSRASTSASASTAIGRWPTRSFSQPVRVISRRLLRRRARTAASCPRSTTATSAAAATRRTASSTRPERRCCEPLFTTSFLIDDFLADNAFFGAQHGAGLERVEQDRLRDSAFAWRGGAARPARRRVVGLTSPANLAFTRELGCYDEVRRATTTSTTLPAERPRGLRRHERRRRAARGRPRPLARLAGLQLLGRRHALGSARRRQGAARAAPGAVLRAGAGQEARRRVGRDRLEQRLASAWHGFIERVGDRRRRGCASSRAAGAMRCSDLRRTCSTAASPPPEGRVLTL